MINEPWIGGVCVRAACLHPWTPLQLLHPPFYGSLAGKPAYLQILRHTSAPKFRSLLSQTLPSPLPCLTGEQTFCTVHCNMVRSSCSMVDTGEFYICPCIFFLPVNVLILLSCIPLFVFPTNASSRRKSV